MRTTRLGLAAVGLVLALGLSGCSAEPEDEVRAGVRDVIAAANSNDAATLRQEAEALLSTLSELGGSGRIDAARETQLRDLVLAILEDAALLDPAPSPSPSPSPTRAPSRAPSVAPSPSPSPSPPPSPSPSPSPSPTRAAPSPSPSPTDDDDEPGLNNPLDPSPVSESRDAPKRDKPPSAPGRD